MPKIAMALPTVFTVGLPFKYCVAFSRVYKDPCFRGIRAEFAHQLRISACTTKIKWLWHHEQFVFVDTSHIKTVIYLNLNEIFILTFIYLICTFENVFFLC